MGNRSATTPPPPRGCAEQMIVSAIVPDGRSRTRQRPIVKVCGEDVERFRRDRRTGFHI